MTESGQIRISDDDRDRYAHWLRVAFSEGRITESELEDRLAEVFEAKTENDLIPLVADLPQPVPVAADSRPSISLGPANHFNDIAISALRWYFPALICTAIWAMSGGGDFWPIWVFFGLSTPFAWSLLGGDDNGSDSESSDDDR